MLPVCRDGPPSIEWGFTTIAVLLDIMGGLFSSGGVTSSPMLSFSAILMGFWNFVEKCDNPMSSKLLFLRGLPMFGSPCLSELDLEIFCIILLILFIIHLTFVTKYHRSLAANWIVLSDTSIQ